MKKTLRQPTFYRIPTKQDQIEQTFIQAMDWYYFITWRRFKLFPFYNL